MSNVYNDYKIVSGVDKTRGKLPTSNKLCHKYLDSVYYLKEKDIKDVIKRESRKESDIHLLHNPDYLISALGLGNEVFFYEFSLSLSYNPDETKNFIEKKFRQFESNEQKRLKIEVRE
ncbi:hypothetical protein AKJ65_04010 [candidate division MSBL1 archaeon SCGC-AAA259E19]|uniref:Uncharacterized protein n=1 Tax=candidate division MSBL1 archaeon SCGC-AAA259E19 TaxID=1698264 RepID=A0A133UK44_9EURY|nr:hypothetical protein AKJ65_04010 [candidate division MSBL1 archaeon SCGC-AAA259E19]